MSTNCEHDMHPTNCVRCCNDCRKAHGCQVAHVAELEAQVKKLELRESELENEVEYWSKTARKYHCAEGANHLAEEKVSELEAELSLVKMERSQHILGETVATERVAELERWQEQTKHVGGNNVALLEENVRLREVLELIATPKRADGTYNRSRESCEELAREALSPRQDCQGCHDAIKGSYSTLPAKHTCAAPPERSKDG